MCKRICSFLLVFVLVLGLTPVTALTVRAAGEFIQIGHTNLYAGDYLEQGKSSVTAAKPDDNYAYYDGTVLELHNYVSSEGIAAGADLTIRLFGNNKIGKYLECGSSDLTVEGTGKLLVDGGNSIRSLGADAITMKSGVLEITNTSRAVSGVKSVNYPKNAISLFSKKQTGSWEPFSMDKLKDANYYYARILLICSASFGAQSPAMPAGQITHDLGTVSASSYPVSFRGADWALDLKSAGYVQYEKIGIVNSAGELVAEKTTESDGTGITYDMNQLPPDRYTVTEIVRIEDPEGNTKLFSTHTFTVNWQPIYTISGTVSGAERDETVRVRLYNESGALMQSTTVNGSGNGSYSFTDVEPGVYTVYALARGCYDYSAKVTVRGSNVTHDIAMERMTLAIGGIVLKDGEYLSNDRDAAATGNPPSGQGYAYYEDGVLALVNCRRSNETLIFYDEELTVLVYGPSELGAIKDGYDYTGIAGDLKIDMTGGSGLSLVLYGDVAYGEPTMKVRGDITVNGGSFSISQGAYNRIGAGIQDAASVTFSCEEATIIAAGDHAFRNTVVTVKSGNVLAYGEMGSAVNTTFKNTAVQVSTDLSTFTPWDKTTPLTTYPSLYLTPDQEEEEPTDPINPGNPFTDVPGNSYYYDPVMWALSSGVTTGATDTTFDPMGTCMRSHVVTFLHRAKGSPEPKTESNPFTDVQSGSFYYKSVLWAVEEKITSGVSATAFGPNNPCTRAQVVTFLWRAAGSPEPKSANNPFVDVKTGDFYYKAVLWAVENGITAGLDATHFGPGQNCTRAQVVTFLYRTFAK